VTRTVQISLDDRWAIGGKPHGGYLLREMVRPLLSEAHPHPLAVSAHYLRPPDAGAAELELETLRTGRRAGQHRSRLLQGGDPCVEALVTTGALDPEAAPFWSRTQAPVLPPVDQCLRSSPDVAPGMRVGHLEFVDVRWHTPPQGSPEAEGCFTTWVRMDGGETTVLDLLVLADALPPITMDLGVLGWAPTVELTAYVRAVPAPGWLVAEQRARLLEDGWLDEECSIWDSRGRLVCQARQLAAYRLAG
jgi:hypothetical protein